MRVKNRRSGGVLTRALVGSALLTAGCASEPPTVAHRVQPLIAHCEWENVNEPVLGASWRHLVELSGDRAIISYDPSSASQGVYDGVHIYRHEANATWVAEQMLDIEQGLAQPSVHNGDEDDGPAVDIVGDRAVVAFANRVGDSENVIYVELFRLDGGKWKLVDTEALGTVADGVTESGKEVRPTTRVAFDGQHVVVGASFDAASIENGGFGDPDPVTSGEGRAWALAASSTALDVPQALIPTSPGWSTAAFGRDVAVRNGHIAVARGVVAVGEVHGAVAFDLVQAAWSQAGLVALLGADSLVGLSVNVMDDGRVITNISSPNVSDVAVWSPQSPLYVQTQELYQDVPDNTLVIDSDYDGRYLAIGTVGLFFADLIVFQEVDGVFEFDDRLHDIQGAPLAVSVDAGLVAAFHDLQDRVVAYPIGDLLAAPDEYAMHQGEVLVAGTLPPPPGGNVVVASTLLTDNDDDQCREVEVVLDQGPTSGVLATWDGHGSFIYDATDVPIVACGDAFAYHLESSEGSSESAMVNIGFTDAPLCRRFIFTARERNPIYIYKGCPDPGPMPFRDPLRVQLPSSRETAYIELASAVPLGTTLRAAPRSGSVDLRVLNHIAYTPREGFVGVEELQVTLTDGACSYDATVEVTVGP